MERKKISLKLKEERKKNLKLKEKKKSLNMGKNALKLKERKFPKYGRRKIS